MKLPIQRVAKSSPPKFMYYQTVHLPTGGTQSMQCITAVPASMERALCDLLDIVDQLVLENEALKKQVRK